MLELMKISLKVIDTGLAWHHDGKSITKSTRDATPERREGINIMLSAQPLTAGRNCISLDENVSKVQKIKIGHGLLARYQKGLLLYKGRTWKYDF